MKDYKLLLLFLIGIGIFSCEDIIEVPDISDQSVEILAPLDNSQLDTLNINFNWNFVEDAEQYRFQIAEPSFMEAEQFLVDELINEVDSLNTGNNFNYEFATDGDYEWRVKALNSAYETSYTTAGFNINTQ